MSPRGRIGVFGGTFDPPHVGHRIVAADVIEALELDRLVIVPAPRPPHRSAVLPADLRLELTRRSFAADTRVEVSDVEFGREGKSYMVDTLEGLRGAMPHGRLFLVIGCDQYEGLGGWRRPARIVELAELAVMRRDGRPPTPDPRYPFRAVDVTRIDLSSTEIRRRLATGRSIRYLVPDVILDDVERAWAERERDERLTGTETTC